MVGLAVGRGTGGHWTGLVEVERLVGSLLQACVFQRRLVPDLRATHARRFSWWPGRERQGIATALSGGSTSEAACH